MVGAASSSVSEKLSLLNYNKVYHGCKERIVVYLRTLIYPLNSLLSRLSSIGLIGL